MKRLITAVAVAVLLISPAVLSAQEHILEVRRYPDYAKDYLTITDIGLYLYPIDGQRNIGSYKVSIDYIDGYFYPWPGQVITEINGRSTKGISEEEFYAVMDRLDSVSVCLMDRNAGGSVKLTLYPNKEWPNDLSKWGVTLLQINNLKKNASIWGKRNLSERGKDNSKLKIYMTEMVDSDYDWFYARTYDFAISGNDPLMDKTLLEKFAELCLDMSRDTENPDILLTVAKNADESIQTTYIPPSSRTVNLGATTTARYNFLTQRNDYVTRQNSYAVREGDYTKTTRDVNLFLEITMLDARKINDSLQTAPPVIYQFTTTRHVVNPEFNLDDELIAYASWGIKSNPGWNKYAEAKMTAYYPAVGFSGLEVTYVAENSRAWQAGLRPGDRIERYKYSKKGKWIKESVPDISNSKYTVLYRCVVKRDGKTVRLDNVPLNERFGDIEFLFWK